MANYSIGVDLANDSDYTAVAVLQHRKIKWYHFWLKRLHLIKHIPSPFKIVDSFTDPTERTR